MYIKEIYLLDFKHYESGQLNLWNLWANHFFYVVTLPLT